MIPEDPHGPDYSRELVPENQDQKSRPSYLEIRAFPITEERYKRVSRLNTITKLQFDHYLLSVRMGATPHVAAAAMGVIPSTFRGWIELGRKECDRSRLGMMGQFFLATLIAQSEARVAAELVMHRTQPGVWLKAMARIDSPGLPSWHDPKESSDSDVVSGDGMIDVELSEDATITRLKVSDGLLQSALDNLQEAGIITVNRSGISPENNENPGKGTKADKTLNGSFVNGKNGHRSNGSNGRPKP